MCIYIYIFNKKKNLEKKYKYRQNPSEIGGWEEDAN